MHSSLTPTQKWNAQRLGKNTIRRVGSEFKAIRKSLDTILQACIVNDRLDRCLNHTEPDLRALTKINVADKMKAFIIENMDFNLVDDELLYFFGEFPF